MFHLSWELRIKQGDCNSIVCKPRWWVLACLSLSARSERRLARSERNWIGTTVLSRHLNRGSVWTLFSVQQEVGISLNNNEVWSWTLFCKSCNQTWKRFCFLDLRVFEENQSAQLLDEFVFRQWQLSWKMEICRSVFAFYRDALHMFHGPKRVSWSRQDLSRGSPHWHREFYHKRMPVLVPALTVILLHSAWIRNCSLARITTFFFLQYSSLHFLATEFKWGFSICRSFDRYLAELQGTFKRCFPAPAGSIVTALGCIWAKKCGCSGYGPLFACMRITHRRSGYRSSKQWIWILRTARLLYQCDLAACCCICRRKAPILCYKSRNSIGVSQAVGVRVGTNAQCKAFASRPSLMVFFLSSSDLSFLTFLSHSLLVEILWSRLALRNRTGVDTESLTRFGIARLGRCIVARHVLGLK